MRVKWIDNQQQPSNNGSTGVGGGQSLDPREPEAYLDLGQNGGDGVDFISL